MTLPFEVLARLRHDVRVLKLPPLARLALYHLASEGGAIHTADLTTEEALDLLERGAGESAGRALDLGVIEHLNTVLRLVFTTPDGGGGGPRYEPMARAPGPPPRDAPPLPVDPPAAPIEAAHPRTLPPPPPARRRAPSQTPEAQRQRKVLAWFVGRTGPCATVPTDVTWEAWSTSAEGVDLLRVGRPRGGSRNKVAGVVPCPRNKATESKEQPRGEQGVSKEQPKNKQGTTKEQPLSETDRHSAELPEEKKETTNDDAHEGSRNNPPGEQGTTPPASKDQPTQGTTLAPRAASKEQPPVAPPALVPVPTSETPHVDALVAANGIVPPSLNVVRTLEARLVAAGLTVADAADWGAGIATPEGRKISWPWIRKPEQEITAAFLQFASLDRGHDPWSRVGEGFAAWRAWRERQAKARAKAATRPAAHAAPARVSDLPTAKVATAAGSIAATLARRNQSLTPTPNTAHRTPGAAP